MAKNETEPYIPFKTKVAIAAEAAAIKPYLDWYSNLKCP
jgi:hypothetical protein